MQAGRSFRIWTTALLLSSSAVDARAADSNFFEELDKVEKLTDSAGLLKLQTSSADPRSTQRSLATKRADVDASLSKPLENATGAAAATQPLDPIGSKSKHGAPSTTPPRVAATIDTTPKALDPEPDGAVLPKTETPTKDPLDRAPTTAGASADKAAAPHAEPLPALNAALKDAIDKRGTIEIKGAGTTERRKERDAVAFFYAARGFGPIWSKDGKPIGAVDSVIARLAQAGDDALTLATTPTSLKTQGSVQEIVESELALTEAVVAYARQATGARVDPRAISPLIGLRPELADPAQVIESIAGANGDAGNKLEALNPNDARYAALRAKLNEILAARAPLAAGTSIPPGPTLHVGMHDQRVPMLRARLHIDPGFGNEDLLRYDSGVAQSVAAYQRANDIAPSGALTNATVAALSGARQSRSEGAIVANMEMWRWMPRDLGANRIEVNIPDYLVTVFHEGKTTLQNRVVVGKTETPTPLFSNTMKYLIVNPYWNVPQSIIKKEMLPKAGGDLSYLNGRGYSASWRGGQWVVKQLPGPKNALGRIKFLFPNDYSVYLHDTPSKSLFSRSRRAYSHGCVRVDQPFAFGQAVMNDSVPEGARQRWSEERLEEMVGEKERYVNLPTLLPIHIEYFTASVDASKGTLKLRGDIYGYTRAVAAALGRTGETAPVAERKPRVVAQHMQRKPAEPVVEDDFDPR